MLPRNDVGGRPVGTYVSGHRLSAVFKQGSRRSGDEENKPRQKADTDFSWLQPLFEPKDSFPDYVLFQLVHINDLVIAPYPFELTVESGRRLEGEIRGHFPEAEATVETGDGHQPGEGYTGYITTPEEYGRRYYEGGHTRFDGKTHCLICKARLGP